MIGGDYIMRQLASVQKILNLEPIINSDNLLKATILGWVCVVNKNDNFKINDLCVFCEIDSLLPEIPEFEFMRKNKFRVKTVKLRGQVSQGLCLPLKILNDRKYPTDVREKPVYAFKEGQDVTALLNITKWEPPIPEQLQGEVDDVFPDVIPKSDETRIQNLQPLIDKYAGQIFYISCKIDGSSITAGINNDKKFVCSRNFSLKLEGDNLTTNAFVSAVMELKVFDKLELFLKKHPEYKNLALQGELAGKNIQCNRLELEYKTIFWYNIFDIDKQKYLDFNDFKNAIAEMNLVTVPILDTNFVLINDIQTLLEMAKGTSVLNKTKQREGIVFRPLNEIYDMDCCRGELKFNRVSFKAINSDYLIEHGI